MMSNKTSVLTNNTQDYTSQVQGCLGSCKDAVLHAGGEEGMAADYDRRSCLTLETF
jgi:hypothetical protein